MCFMYRIVVENRHCVNADLRFFEYFFDDFNYLFCYFS